MPDSSTGPRYPSATYRWQLGPGSGFDEVRRRLPYLRRLGVDTVYLSPVFAARRGSRHGYDGVDPARFDRGRGGEASFRRLARAARRRGLRLLVDIVPNHLAATLENPAWRDVLEKGQGSPFARLFDIDWVRSPGGRTSLAVPWLDRPLTDAFREGQLAFVRTLTGGYLRCGTAHLPVPPRAFRLVDRWLGPRPVGERQDRRARSERALAAVNQGETPAALRLRETMLSMLAYRLVPGYAVAEINYRRFADISDLIGVRTDTDLGFRYMHRGLLRAARRKEIDGVRVDHIDGIADPRAYLQRLGKALEAAARGDRPPYVVVEKVLATHETLPSDWRTAGTTGYEALTRITGVLVRPGAMAALDREYRRFCTDRRGAFADEAYRSKRDVEDQLFSGDRATVVRRLRGKPAIPRAGIPGTAEDTEGALAAVTAALPVYRTYGGTAEERTESATWLRRAWAEARGREPRVFALGSSDWLIERLLGTRSERPPTEGHPDPAVVRWRQWTAAVAAKGIEDTAFYRYVRFLGANEVGSDPGEIGCPLEEFHAFMADRARRWPHALTPTSTHDSKWGEDARARFIALADRARDWGVSARRWHKSARRRGRRSPGHAAPTPSEEYLLYQAWVVTAPPGHAFGAPYLRRFESYLRKAVREAKEQSSWLHPNEDHEDQLLGFVRGRAHDPSSAGFRRELGAWIERLDRVGGYYSLGQVVLRVTLPGVPDLYQGSEGWNLSLVDPDNRRPVRFDRLARLLDRCDHGTGGLPRRLLVSARRGISETLKLGVTSRLLRFRGAHRALFAQGEYLPLAERPARGRAPVVAFARRRGAEWLLVAVGRDLTAVSGPRGGPPVGARWRRRELLLPSGTPNRWRDVLTGRTVHPSRSARGPRLALARVFSDLPVAVLTGAESGRSSSAR